MIVTAILPKEEREKIVQEFAELINRNSLENCCDTPDFLIAEYLVKCLESLAYTINRRQIFRAEVQI